MHKQYDRGMKLFASRGFTVVELVIVVAVIGVLAGIVAASFGNAQKDARDAHVKANAQKFAEAIELWSLQNRIDPRGARVNSGSAMPIITENGVRKCSPSSASGQGWTTIGTGAAAYPCTMEDILVDTGYLESGLLATSPRNIKQSATVNRTFMLYECLGAAGLGGDFRDMMLLYSLEAPTDSEKAQFVDTMTYCGRTSNINSFRESYGMQGIILIDL